MLQFILFYFQSSLASGNGHLEVVECLIKYGANINHINENGHNALHWAAKGHLNVMECLIKNGGNFNFIGQWFLKFFLTTF